MAEFSRVTYTGTGGVFNASFSFPYLDAADIYVYVDGVSVPFTFLNTSTVTPTVNPGAGSTIQVRRATQKASSPVNFTDGSVLLERDLDLLSTYSLYLAQEADDAVTATVSLNTSSQMDAKGFRIVNLANPVASTDAVNRQYFESVYTPLLDNKVTVATAQASLATTKAAEAGVSATAAQTSATSAATSAGTATNRATAASTSATSSEASSVAATTKASEASSSAAGASASASTAITKASEASTSAGTATTKAAEAASSATGASTSAATATTQAGISTTKASEAVVSATAAATSATNSAASAVAAENSYDAFDDRYLGAKAANPALDNDGQTLLVGALYFNTALSEMRVYTGAVWKSASSTVNGTAARQTFTATAAQTTFTLTNGYDAGFADVYLNGFKMVNGVDVIVTSGTSVVLVEAAAAGDVLDVIAYGSFAIANVYSKTESDIQYVAKNASGDVGIGTSTPTDKLQVNGGLTIGNDSGGNRSRFYEYFGLTIEGGDFAGRPIRFNTNSTERLRIDFPGNVLIGTTAPLKGATNRGNITLNGVSSTILNFGIGGVSSGYFYNTATVMEMAADGGRKIQFTTGNTERVSIEATGQLRTMVTGGNAVMDAYACRAWVNFNGTGVVAIRGSGNVSSITDNGVGDYTVNFATAMPDANYSAVMGQQDAVDGKEGARIKTSAMLAGSFGVQNTSDTIYDTNTMCVSIFR